MAADSATIAPDNHDSEQEEHSQKAQLEISGRQRPEKLRSLWQEIGFVSSIVLSQLLTEYFVSGFTILLPTVSEALDIPSSAATWSASAFSLVISSFLIPFGRIADIYGGYPVYISGCIWYCTWSIIAGFAQKEIMLDISRALQGLGPAAYLPAGLKLLGSVYRPGPRKNLVFSIYGAMAPFGFFVGLFFAGVAGEFATWRWYFFIGAMLVAIVTAVSTICVPNDSSECRKDTSIKMDWLGSATIVCGLVLLVFAITDSSRATNGWATPYILVTLVLGVMLIGVAFYIEGWVAEQPLLPFDVFQTPYMRPLCLGLLFAYGTLGIYLVYATLFCMNVLDVGPIQLVAWYAPHGTVGIILAIFGGLLLHILSPMILMFITGVAIILESLLFALVPADAYYWAWIFAPMILSTVAIDFMFNVANIYFSTSLPSRRQGLAGSISNVLLQLGIALLLGFAEVIAHMTSYQGQKQSYHNVFWFNLACGATALVIFMAFVRIPKAKSDLTADEKEAMARVEGTSLSGNA